MESPERSHGGWNMELRKRPWVVHRISFGQNLPKIPQNSMGPIMVHYGDLGKSGTLFQLSIQIFHVDAEVVLYFALCGSLPFTIGGDNLNCVDWRPFLGETWRHRHPRAHIPMPVIICSYTQDIPVVSIIAPLMVWAFGFLSSHSIIFHRKYCIAMKSLISLIDATFVHV